MMLGKRMSAFVVGLYGWGSAGRLVARKLVHRLDGGQIYSPTLREIFRKYHHVDVGAYTMGGCFIPFAFGERTTIGRYTSIAMTAFAATDDHPMHHKGMHGFFFNPALRRTTKPWEFSPLRIGNDVWLGHNSIIGAEVHEIGDGAVVGAGAVVHRDVPPYAVVVGNPARIVRYRFPPETIERLLAERWWEKSIDELDMAEFQAPHLSAQDPAVITDRTTPTRSEVDAAA